MYQIFKITSDPVVDFAAEELKKYLRMMMPEAGDVSIRYDPWQRPDSGWDYCGILVCLPKRRIRFWTMWFM